MIVHKVDYTYFHNERGPYLRVFFYNPVDRKISPESLAILDSGSNKIIMPFSMGKIIDLKPPESLDEFDNLHGVGGTVSFIEQPCIIYLVDTDCGEMYGFWINAAWEYPRGLNIDKIEKMNTKELNKFERSGVILGRDFMNNFEYITFHQRDSNGYFLYEIKESKISRRNKYPDDINQL